MPFGCDMTGRGQRSRGSQVQWKVIQEGVVMVEVEGECGVRGEEGRRKGKGGENEKLKWLE
ncbi:unnamed protein product [Chondrus crispus]|uniref:Uncharacterized protein n=1 Tax=Chondrus crispus TaxID=2769 RepID=R7Q4F4_CHOCR|nr:unnamed protein product [Chondrus crispus]CDF33402.1 unnamed protein product [Chondrus crispus]|eukprot:XP_005713205.1 unnamed protein product [Chondrus crispus]